MKLALSMGLKAHGDAARPLRPHLRILDTASGLVQDALVVMPPPELHPSHHAHAELTCATPVSGGLLQCTRSEVLQVDLTGWRVVERWSHPLMYDVHHACPLSDGRVAVAATGHDSVLIFDQHRNLVAHHWLGDGDFASRFEATTDFRQISFQRFKPHQVHPNHLVCVDGTLWVTCLETQEVRTLSSDGPSYEFPEGPPHDGRFLDGLWWFTTITGHVIAMDLRTGERHHHIDLSGLEQTRRLRGWCRGIEKVGSRLFVGMTMLRASRHREALRRVLKGEAGRKLPTRVLEVDLERGVLVDTYPVGNAAGGTLYSIHALG